LYRDFAKKSEQKSRSTLAANFDRALSADLGIIEKVNGGNSEYTYYKRNSVAELYCNNCQ